MYYTLFRNGNIFTPIDRGAPAGGTAQGEVAQYPGGALLIHDGVVAAVGSEADVVAQVPTADTMQA